MITPFANTFHAWIWEHTWQVTILIALTFLLHILLRKHISREWLAWLWLIPMVRLFLPTVPESSVSFFNLQHRLGKTPDALAPAFPSPDWHHALETTKSPSGIPARDTTQQTASEGETPTIARSINNADERLTNPHSGDQAAINQATPITETPSPPIGAVASLPEDDLGPKWPRFLLPGIWTLGFALGIGRVLCRAYRQHRVIQGLPELEHEEGGLIVQQACQHLGLKPVALRSSSTVSAPALSTIGRPTLLMPEPLLPELTERDWKHIAYHELAHLKRRDSLVGWVMELGCWLHWFNPLVWLMRRQLFVDRELASDAFAVRHLSPSHAQAYGRTLLKVVEHHRSQAPFVSTYHLTMAHRVSEVSRRVRALCSRQPKRGPWQSLLMALAIGALMLIGATDKRALAQSQHSALISPTLTPAQLPSAPPTNPRLREIEAAVTKRVESTLLEATTRPSETDAVFTWISQPGMIRTFGAEHDFIQAYPLYSSPHKAFTSQEELETSVIAAVDWKATPERYTDLNEPVEGRFPILDPRAATEHRVEGFHFDNESISGEEGHLPMPVPWLYALEDGTLGTADEATDANPIVARVAYWADDESCKINVNTASEGIPWDVPKVDTEEDRDYASYQPGLTEHQRHPGHPATTCLSSVLFPNRSYHSAESDKRLTEAELKRIYGLAPSIVWHPRHRIAPEALTHEQPLDETSPYSSVDAYLQAAGDLGSDHLRGFLTANSESPEITVHGGSRMPILPPGLLTHEQEERFRKVAGYHRFRRVLSHSSYDGDVPLRTETHKRIPGYGGSLADKLGVRPEALQDLVIAREHDHLQILTSIADYVRQIGLHQGNRGDFASDFVRGYGQITPFSSKGHGVENHLENWSDTQSHPQGAGRIYTLSEAALVIYQTGELQLDGWKDGRAVVSQRVGPDTDIIQQILSNRHPLYQQLGKTFGPDDIGHRFAYIEVGLIPEVFCPSHGHDPIIPRQSMRLLYEGANLKLNGIPLTLWGNAVGIPKDVYGPAVMSSDPLSRRAWEDLPAGWYPWGGSGGIRLMRFGTFRFDEQAPGFYDNRFLPNGLGPLSHFYCQTAVILRDDETLTLTQENPMELLVYDAVGEDVHLHNAVQQFRLRWAAPHESVPLAKPLRNHQSFAGWTRRFRNAASVNARLRPIPVLEPEFHETIVSLHVSHGDYRHAAMKRHVPSELFTRHAAQDSETRTAHALTESGAKTWQVTPGATFAEDLHGRGLVEGVTYHEDVRPDFPSNVSDRQAFAPLLDENYHFPIDPTITRDFDNGFGNAPDGAYINKPDEGAPIDDEGAVPYFDVPGLVRDSLTQAKLPLLRMINSPVAFGSLPSALQAHAPWTTLLFRPNVAHNPDTHPHLGEAGNGLTFLGYRETVDGFRLPRFGSVTGQASLPPDHLWLDLFWMPALEPQHLHADGVTRGKVNLNYQMMPFPHIHRSTALHAVFKSERLLAIPTEAGPVYKTETRPTYRHAIDAHETLKQFEEKFARGEVFLTESEICEHFLLPKGVSWDEGGLTVRAFWDAHRLTGDNSLERPYGNLYPRLTTKSNTFRLHMRIQLRDPATGAYGQDYRNTKIVNRSQDA